MTARPSEGVALTKEVVMRVLRALTLSDAVVVAAGCGGEKSVVPASSVATAPAPGVPDEVAAERAKFSPEDRALEDAQEWCAVSTDGRLGSMGPPLKLDIEGQPVFVCCKGCKRKAETDPEMTLAAVAGLKA